MKPMTDSLREQIKKRIKNKLDISNLIEDVIITGEDLSNAIIKRFNRNKDNLSKCNFTNCVIGTEGKITSITHCKVIEANFSDVVFKGKIFFRYNDARNSTFNGARMENFEYQFTNFKGCKFCEALIRIGSSYGLGAKFSNTLFDDLTKNWNIEVKVREE